MFTKNKHIKQYIFWFLMFVLPLHINAQNDITIQSFLDSADVLKEVKPLDALKYGFEAKTLAEQYNNTKYIAQAHHKIATIYRILGDLSTAEQYIDSALIYPITDYNDLIEFNMAKGIILKQLCKYDESLECFNNNLIVQQSQHDLPGEGRTYNNIGRIYLAMELYPKALHYYRKAFHIYDKLPLSKGTGLILTNIGHVYRETNVVDSALFYYKVALPIFQKVNNPILIAYAYRSIGSVTENEDQAIDYLNRSIDIIKETGSINELKQPYLQLGEVYFKNGQYKLAVENLRNSVELTKGIEHGDQLREAYFMLSRSYDSLGDYKNALYYQTNYYHIKDSINSQNNIRAMQEYESNIKLQEKQNENKIQQIEIENTNEKLRVEHQQNVSFLIGVIILVILLIIVVVQVLKQKRNNTVLEIQKSQIEKKEKEKEVLIREIHHRVKNNLQIISSLLKLDQRKTENVEVKAILSKSTQRIEAIAYIHEKLYQQNDLTDVDIEEYLFDIGESLLLSFDKLNKVELNIKSNVTDLHADVAINLGMLTAELITNSIKHGFTENATDFKINLTLENKVDFISFYYADNGEQTIDFNNLEKPKSFGMNLIKSTIKKLHGKPIINSNLSGGFNLMFNFKVHE